jgi:crotonobetainyl-CoA:carnitine CoA-transferase CaiB-like acyl-CoA transferase
MSRPYSGIRVLDLTHVLAGPFCSWQFALLGADVIKIENPREPDCARGRGPDAQDNARGLGLNYQVQGTNKRAIALDLATPEGHSILLSLVRTSDVLIENYRTGALDALGLGYLALREIRPELVYCSITGYGDRGPRAATNAYDNTIQAAAGVISQSGDHKPGLSFVDYAAGLNAAFAVSAALFRRSRDGVGSHVTCSMFETALMLMAPEVAAELRPREAARPKEAGLSSYATSDGRIMLGAFTPKQNKRLWAVLSSSGHDKHDFADAEDWPALWRKSSRMREALSAILLTRTSAEWKTLFDQAGVPAEPVRSLAEAIKDPQLQQTGFFVPEPDRGEGLPRHSMPLAGYRLSEDGPSLDSPAPPLGADTDRILDELGLPASEIAELRRKGVVR